MADPNFYIETPRLILSHMNPTLDTHCDFFLELSNTPEVRAGNGGLALTLADREAARTNISENNRHIQSTGYGRYFISLKPSSLSSADTPTPVPEQLETFTKIGSLSIKVRLPDGPTLPDIGFALLTPFAGQGYVTEAAKGLLTYFQQVRGQTKFLGYCDPANAKSMAVFKRLGWRDHGGRGIKGLAAGRIVNGNVWSFGVESGLEEFGL
ncbi:hypothetical protein DM02DRAFT_613587 [Periconia macrospinosa]|uniref:N-acetyltransferase domain-containing protein n=1 Tax=Periconia macrospinosa TaxID=97972 RepID=A0A2V1DTN1_9PLEO|nr:hypothetical protein DM02DRAFT_613587 [Periconia macrospinosa]